MNTSYRKPAAPQSLVDAPVPGPAVAMTVEVAVNGETHTSVGCALLGPGRDYMTRDDAVEVANGFGDAVTCTVSDQYETMLALVNDFPTASLDPTAKHLLAVERTQDDYRQQVEDWKRLLDEAGLEPCDKCGGAGGWKGWPGFTCYDCGGSGTQEREES